MSHHVANISDYQCCFLGEPQAINSHWLALVASYRAKHLLHRWGGSKRG